MGQPQTLRALSYVFLKHVSGGAKPQKAVVCLRRPQELIPSGHHWHTGSALAIAHCHNGKRAERRPATCGPTVCGCASCQRLAFCHRGRESMAIRQQGHGPSEERHPKPVCPTSSVPRWGHTVQRNRQRPQSASRCATVTSFQSTRRWRKLRDTRATKRAADDMA